MGLASAGKRLLHPFSQCGQQGGIAAHLAGGLEESSGLGALCAARSLWRGSGQHIWQDEIHVFLTRVAAVGIRHG